MKLAEVRKASKEFAVARGIDPAGVRVTSPRVGAFRIVCDCGWHDLLIAHLESHGLVIATFRSTVTGKTKKVQGWDDHVRPASKDRFTEMVMSASEVAWNRALEGSLP